MHPVSILSVCFLLPARCILLTAYCILHIASCILLGSGQELENALCRFRIFVILATPSPPSLHWQPWGHPHHLCHSFSLLPLVTLSTLVTLLLSAPLPTRLHGKPGHPTTLTTMSPCHPCHPTTLFTLFILFTLPTLPTIAILSTLVTFSTLGGLTSLATSLPLQPARLFVPSSSSTCSDNVI